MRGNREVSSLVYCLDDEFWRSQEQKVLSLMDQGLKDRSKSVRVIWRNTSSECNFEEVYIIGCSSTKISWCITDLIMAINYSRDCQS